MTAKILKMPKPKPNIHCSKCGVSTKAACSCNAAYITHEELMERRKDMAIELYDEGRGLTMQQIAERLGVDQKTISNDLKDFNLGKTPKLKPVPKTASNPKGAGRPKGSGGRARKTPKLDKARDIVRPMVEAGKVPNSRKLQAEYGISHVHFETAIAAERARKEAEPQIDPDTLSMTMRQKFDMALRQYKRQMDNDFEHRIRQEVQKRLEDTILPAYEKSYKEYREVIEGRKGVMTGAVYRKILSCLHPDRVDPALKA